MQVKSLNATVDISTSVGGEKRGKVTDFKEIRGYILVRKPGMLRMIGLYPIVRNKAFDIVSDGSEFKLLVSATNKFYVGHNQVIEGSDNPLDTLRPQAIYDALLLQAVNPDNEIAFMESSTEMVVDPQTHKLVKQPNYVLDIIRKGDKGWTLARKVYFDRTNLVPHRQVVYDPDGDPSTDASYQFYKDYDGVQYPSYIDIKRPQEEYDIRLIMVKLVINPVDQRRAVRATTAARFHPGEPWMSAQERYGRAARIAHGIGACKQFRAAQVIHFCFR